MFFIFVVTCHADRALIAFVIPQASLPKFGEVNKTGPRVSLFDFITGDSPCWSFWVSCRKSTFDVWLCGREVVGQKKWREWKRGELRVKGQGSSWRGATMDSILLFLRSDDSYGQSCSWVGSRPHFVNFIILKHL